MKRYIAILIVLLAGFGCEEFLEEDFRSGENSQSILSSEESFETYINSVYVSLRAWYGKENSWDLTEAGTDLYTWGLDNRSLGFCTYQSFTTSEEQTRMSAIWREFYKAINNCNVILDAIDDVPYDNEALREQRRAEVLFLRAHYYWLVAEIWGGVHFNTEPSVGADQEVNRTPVETFYQQIIGDLEASLLHLPEQANGAEYGRVTKAAAEAMLARVHLYRKDYAEAQQYAQNVIDNYGFMLLDDWTQIWSLDNIRNPEIIWAVNYSDDPTFTTTGLTDLEGELYDTEGLIQREGGHQGHVMWEIRYENLSWGLVRDLDNGRGFQRWAPTKYFIDLFDEEVDERFWGSFKNLWFANNADVIPKWFPFTWVDGVQMDVPQDQWATPMFEVGDTAIVFSKKPVPESEKGKRRPDDLFYFHPEEGYLIIDINDMYLPDGSLNDNVINRQFYFPITKKYFDDSRPQLSTAYSKRDAYVFRISEMYLIAAEAAMMSGNMSGALNYINSLREARSVEGREDEMRVSEADLDIDFILDERARELATEFQRFFDLKRTDKLIERVQAYNHDAAPFIQDYHELRFIPQSQIDAMENGSDYQNPGY